MKDTALLIIDVQNDYFPGGKMELPGADEAAANTKILQNKFRDNDLPVIHVAHESVKEGSTFFLPGSKGQEINDTVSPLENETVITKNYPNSFLHTNLEETLKSQNISKLLITGMMTFMCVDATTRAGVDLGFQCTLVHDCTTTPPVEFNGISCNADQAKTAFIGALSHICDKVVSTEEALNSF